VIGSVVLDVDALRVVDRGMREIPTGRGATDGYIPGGVFFFYSRLSITGHTTDATVQFVAVYRDGKRVTRKRTLTGGDQ